MRKQLQVDLQETPAGFCYIFPKGADLFSVQQRQVSPYGAVF